MKKLALIVSVAGLTSGFFLFDTTAAHAVNSEAASSETMANSGITANDFANRQAEIDNALKLAQQQFEMQQKQIAQDILDAQQHSQKRHEDLHNDFETIQNQIDQTHNDFQNHFNEVNDQLQTDHVALENQWTQAKEQLDQARNDFNGKLADLEKLQKKLNADRSTINQSISNGKKSAQSVDNQLTTGVENTQKATSDIQNRVNDIEGSVNRIKGILDSAGNDLSVKATKAEQISDKMPASSSQNIAGQANSKQQSKEFPKTNDYQNTFLSLVGISVVGSIVFFYARKIYK
ncbi:LPXTG cell wall anchor domain-containing protein [Enterococcus sp. DIV0756]|uniref:LPXTG cell wall anchor domain-containing protein n=1 Tax=Enterococcus sp. DIV0756 TaxID=2774636 RepID=UPI003F23857B